MGFRSLRVSYLGWGEIVRHAGLHFLRTEARLRFSESHISVRLWTLVGESLQLGAKYIIGARLFFDRGPKKQRKIMDLPNENCGDCDRQENLIEKIEDLQLNSKPVNPHYN